MLHGTLGKMHQNIDLKQDSLHPIKDFHNF